MSKRWRRTMEDVRVYRGADAGSDHELVIASLKVRLATSGGTSNRTTTDKAFGNFHTLITRPAPWVVHCPAKPIPNINRPVRAIYRCQVGTDQNIIPCNMWREPRIQEKYLQELAKQGHHCKDRGTQDHQEPTSSGQDKGTDTGSPKGIQRTTEGS